LERGEQTAPFAYSAMAHVTICNLTTSLPTCLSALHCESFLCRLRGLMFRSRLALDDGLLLVQMRDSRLNASIHMLFVFTDLAVIWINANHEVVDTVLARAWRPIYFPRQAAKYILEIHPDRLNEFKIGDEVTFQ
jgi:uncharacterized membrane protein (UPF0127 family)